jgi:hypothetical protein
MRAMKGVGMRTSLRLALALLVVTLVPSLGASTAAASRSIQLRGAERNTTSSGLVVVGNTQRLEQETISCDVTLLKTVTTAIPKVPGTRFGSVTGIAIDRGTSGAPHCQIRGFESLLDVIPLAGRGPGIHRELGSGVLLYDVSGPTEWDLLYDGFHGSLPEIASVDYHIRQARLRIQLLFLGIPGECLFEGPWYKEIVVVRGTSTILTINLERTRFRTTEGSFFCLEYTSSGQLRVRPTITITLL